MVSPTALQSRKEVWTGESQPKKPSILGVAHLAGYTVFCMLNFVHKYCARMHSVHSMHLMRPRRPNRGYAL